MQRIQINWKNRLLNKATLTGLVATTVTFIYSVLGIFEIVPPIGQDLALNYATVIIQLLVYLGIVTDPNTKGVADSDRAMEYDKPV